MNKLPKIEKGSVTSRVNMNPLALNKLTSEDYDPKNPNDTFDTKYNNVSFIQSPRVKKQSTILTPRKPGTGFYTKRLSSVRNFDDSHLKDTLLKQTFQKKHYRDNLKISQQSTQDALQNSFWTAYNGYREEAKFITQQNSIISGFQNETDGSPKMTEQSPKSPKKRKSKKVLNLQKKIESKKNIPQFSQPAAEDLVNYGEQDILNNDVKPKQEKKELSPKMVSEAITSPRKDAKYLLEKYKNKPKIGVTSEVFSQNDYVNESILKLQDLNPMNKTAILPNVSAQKVFQKTNIEFSRMTARLNKIVSSRDQTIVEIYEKANHDFTLIEGLSLNLKIKTKDKLAPLKIFFTSPEGSGKLKQFSVYISDDYQEPNQNTQNLANLLNPDKFILKGNHLNPTTGQLGFSRPFLYLTIVPNIDFKLRITCHFKPDLNAKKKTLADLQEDDPFIEQLKRQKEYQQQGEPEVFSLGEGGSITQKKNRIQMQVKRLIEDQQSFETMKEHTRKMKEQRLKSQGLNNAPKIFQKPDLISQDFYLTADPQLIDMNEEENQYSQVAFIQKNTKVAPFYRQYTVEKRRMNQLQLQQKVQQARMNAEQILQEKRKYHEFYLKKWQYYRQIEDIRRNKEFLEYRKKQSVIFWIKMEKAKFMLKLAYQNFKALLEYKQLVVFQNMKVTKIKRFLRKRLKAYGMDQFTRFHRKFMFCGLIHSQCILPTAFSRAANIIKSFLDHNKPHHFVKVKIKQTWDRAERIKLKFQVYKKRSDQKYKMLVQYIETVINKQKMQAVMDKNKKWEKQLKQISPGTKDWVLQRYFKYAKDQHAEQYSLWMRQVAKLTRREKIGIELRMGIFLKIHKQKSLSYQHENLDPIEVIPSEGKEITALIPCLDPDIPESSKIDLDSMSQRIIVNEILQYYQSEDCTPNFLAENNPDFVNYMPSQEIAEKLIKRMTQVKDPVKELWSGFEIVKDIFTGQMKYARVLSKEEQEVPPVPEIEPKQEQEEDEKQEQ